MQENLEKFSNIKRSFEDIWRKLKEKLKLQKICENLFLSTSRMIREMQHTHFMRRNSFMKVVQRWTESGTR